MRRRIESTISGSDMAGGVEVRHVVGLFATPDRPLEYVRSEADAELLTHLSVVIGEDVPG